jgi:SAM-dependent methyltransferase
VSREPVPPRPVERKTLTTIAQEWDAAAETRARQVREEVDLSFHRVLLPTLLRLATPADLNAVVDIGCGTGYLSREFARRAGSVVGVDISRVSVALAEREYRADNLRFEAASVERFSQQQPGEFSFAVANMTLMTAPNLRSLLAATARVLIAGGRFAFTITHPWFWPVYWGYSNQPWFKYMSEVGVEAPLRISLDDDGDVTTHYHRPLTKYVDELSRSGFVVELLEEPMPRPRDAAAYPEPWQFPRFLAGRCLLVP